MKMFDDDAIRRIEQVVRRFEATYGRNIPLPYNSRYHTASEPTVTFRNNTGEAVPPYAVLGVSDVEADGQGCERLVCVKPSATIYRVYVVNGPFAVAAPEGEGEECGQCYHCGVVRVVYDTGTPANGETWGPYPDQFTASVQGLPCLTILGIWDSENKIAIARLHEIGTLIGKLDGALSQGGSATVSIWSGAGGSEADTGVNIVAYDWLMKEEADDIAGGKKVVVKIINGVPYVVEAECP